MCPDVAPRPRPSAVLRGPDHKVWAKKWPSLSALSDRERRRRDADRATARNRRRAGGQGRRPEGAALLGPARRQQVARRRRPLGTPSMPPCDQPWWRGSRKPGRYECPPHRLRKAWLAESAERRSWRSCTRDPASVSPCPMSSAAMATRRTVVGARTSSTAARSTTAAEATATAVRSSQSWRDAASSGSFRDRSGGRAGGRRSAHGPPRSLARRGGSARRSLRRSTM